jgi:hypothetical protein
MKTDKGQFDTVLSQMLISAEISAFVCDENMHRE